MRHTSFDRISSFKTVLYSLYIAFFIIATPAMGQISISMKNTTIGKVVESIKNQSSYNFFFEDIISEMQVESIHLTNASIDDAMKALLKDRNIGFVIDENKIVYLSQLSQPKTTRNASESKRMVSGVVNDEKSEPLIGVSIIVKGTSVGTTTDNAGNYRLEVPSDNAQLEFSYIGYHLQTVTVANRSVLNVTLREDTQMIDEVVVTALGIKREKKLLGYAIQELKGEEMNRTANSSVVGALQGKVAGVQMNISPTGLNGSTKITIRGNSSLTDNNQPLWIVDGIPFGDASNSNVSVYGGIDRGGTSVDINPEDIESVSILKGPNAAALYGSRAGNGVILITTKKGVADKGFGINYNSTVIWTKVAETLEMQTKYGQGEKGLYSKSVFSYGKELDGSMMPAWWKNNNGATIPYSYQGNKLEDYFNTGFSQNHNISIGNVSDNGHYRTSFGYLNNQGLFDDEQLERFNIDLNSGRKITAFLSMDSKISLSKTTAKNRPYIGLYGEMYQLLYIPQNISLKDLKEHSTVEVDHPQSGETYQIHDNWLGPDQDYRNPYWMRRQRTNMDERWRMFGYHSMKIDFNDWLWAVGKVSIDYYRTKVEETDKGLGLNIENIILNDVFSKSEQNFYEMNAEFMIHGNNQVHEKIRIDYGIGGNSMYYRDESLSAVAQNMNHKDVWFINSAGQQVYSGNGIPVFANQALQQKKVNSLYASFQMVYDDFVSLDITGRNDWSSTLPAPYVYFYPSFNMSFIGTEFINKMGGVIPSWLTYGKIRGSFAKAGKDTQPYSLKTYNTYTQSFTGPQYNRTKTYISSDFKPEMNTSYEAGIELKLLKNKLGIELTAYKSVTDNQIMLIPTTTASTFDNWRINAGSVRNQGLEFAMYAAIVESKNFNFSIDVNVAHNNTIVDELHADKKYVDFGVDNFFVTVGAVEGGRLGDIYAARIYKRDASGNVIINKYTGLPQTEGRTSFDNKYILGNIQPDVLMSVAPRFTLFKDISISSLFDMKFGGNIVSVTEAIATHYGTALRTIDRNEEYVIPGVYADGTPNTKAVTKEMYYRYIGDTGKNNGMPESFVYDASYVKFRELAIAYSLNRKLLKSTPFSMLKLSFVARDLCFLMKHTPGTSPEGGFDTSMYSQAFDYLSTPNTSTFGFSVNAVF